MDRKPCQHHRRQEPSLSFAKALEAVAILLLADANDDDEEIMAMAIGGLACAARREERCGRWGHRGSYVREKSKDFFNVMLYGFSERWFKAWLRYVYLCLIFVPVN